MKAFLLAKGNKAAGSMAVFLAIVDEARSMIENRLAKIGGQIAFRGGGGGGCGGVSKGLGYYQSRYVRDTTCGRCLQKRAYSD